MNRFRFVLGVFSVVVLTAPASAQMFANRSHPLRDWLQSRRSTNDAAPVQTVAPPIATMPGTPATAMPNPPTGTTPNTTTSRYTPSTTPAPAVGTPIPAAPVMTTTMPEYTSYRTGRIGFFNRRRGAEAVVTTPTPTPVPQPPATTTPVPLQPSTTIPPTTIGYGGGCGGCGGCGTATCSTCGPTHHRMFAGRHTRGRGCC